VSLSALAAPRLYTTFSDISQLTQTHFEKALKMNTQLIRVFFLTQRPAYMWEESHLGYKGNLQPTNDDETRGTLAFC
jgi:hypothetical protein